MYSVSIHLYCVEGLCHGMGLLTNQDLSVFNHPIAGQVFGLCPDLPGKYLRGDLFWDDELYLHYAPK